MFKKDDKHNSIRRIARKVTDNHDQDIKGICPTCRKIAQWDGSKLARCLNSKCSAALKEGHQYFLATNMIMVSVTSYTCLQCGTAKSATSIDKDRQALCNSAKCRGLMTDFIPVIKDLNGNVLDLESSVEKEINASILKKGK